MSQWDRSKLFVAMDMGGFDFNLEDRDREGGPVRAGHGGSLDIDGNVQMPSRGYSHNI